LRETPPPSRPGIARRRRAVNALLTRPSTSSCRCYAKTWMPGPRFTLGPAFRPDPGAAHDDR
jgi:hypothetical protein